MRIISEDILADIAVSSLPGLGPEFYRQCLKFHTSTNLTVTEIHQLGLDEVERIEREMEDIVTEMGYTNTTLPEFTDMIRFSQHLSWTISRSFISRNDPNNYYDSPEALLEAFVDIVENRVEPHLLEIFNSKPKSKLIIKGFYPHYDVPLTF